MNIKELREFGKKKLIENNIDEAIFKVNILLEHVLKMDKMQLLLNDESKVPSTLEREYIDSIEKIVRGTPIQYITNKQEFMGLNFWVDESVLIPQPDTEVLVEETIKRIKKDSKILDLCTGSGAIAISLVHYLKNNFNLEIYASDISEKAIEIAKRNELNIEKNNQIKFINSDMFKSMPYNDFDIIVSNPPYIEKGIIHNLSREVQNEPHIALDGGEDGLDYYRIIAKEGYKHLKHGGYILLEIGYNQRKNITDIFKEYDDKYCDIECIKDLNMHDRVILIKLK